MHACLSEQTCGTVTSWKRVEDVETKKPKGFGFCEYDKADHVRRALRLLNGFKIGPNELLLKVDSKTQAYLDDFIKRKKEMLVAAKSVTLTPANLAEVDIKLGDTEEQFEKDEAEEDENLKSQLLAYYDENLVATGAITMIERLNAPLPPPPPPPPLFGAQGRRPSRQAGQ
mmetsp:Transcript_48330/g.40915  ORF Transcript_48330/g.40915 Transcript_48330/m.40915 type:complete len:171 (+) Transcript_48330:489-1001(+)